MTMTKKEKATLAALYDRCAQAEAKAVKVETLAMALFDLVEEAVRAVAEEVAQEKVDNLDVQIN